MTNEITIWSGFQTGADVAGIKAARKVGFKTKGYIPKGYLTEKGNKPQYKEYGAIEGSSTNYKDRTLKNVVSTDCTIIFDEAGSGGSKLTRNYCQQNNKPYLYLNKSKSNSKDVVDKIIGFIDNIEPNSINIAGNRESKSKGIEKKVFNILTEVFTKLNKVKINEQSRL